MKSDLLLSFRYGSKLFRFVFMLRGDQIRSIIPFPSFRHLIHLTPLLIRAGADSRLICSRINTLSS